MTTMTTATRTRPITPATIHTYAGSRVRMVVVDSELLDRDMILVGDLICYVRRVDGKGTGEAILVDVTGKGFAVALRRIRSIDWYGTGPPVYRLERDPAGQAEAVRVTRTGRHRTVMCRRCRGDVEPGVPHRDRCTPPDLT